ncbi:hypothetical protein ACIRPT_17105 [Streptomyces sp. NPDC101227]|uniref:hypothetical protein n=1 Tax=Streptomyces sp. NPDC101227 TaxID=3366136 RepID=UPI00381F9EF3
MSDDERPPEVGDLVQDAARDREAIVTDIRFASAYVLRSRYGAPSETWEAGVLQLEILARRGEWRRP